MAFALVLGLVVTIPAGYLLANVNFQGRKALLWATLIMMLLPADATVLPMYMELYMMKLINTPWAIILPAGMVPFGVYLTYTYYKTVMHRDIVDAAKVDGCSDIQMFRFIGLPMAQSVVAMLLFTQFSALWNGFFNALLFLERDQLKTLPVGIYRHGPADRRVEPQPLRLREGAAAAPRPGADQHHDRAAGDHRLPLLAAPDRQGRYLRRDPGRITNMAAAHGTPDQPDPEAYHNWRYRIGLDPLSYLMRLVLTALIALYFGLPVIWLFIAPTKTHKQMTDLPRWPSATCRTSPIPGSACRFTTAG